MMLTKAVFAIHLEHQMQSLQLLLGLALKTMLHLSNPYNTLLPKSKDYILVNQGY